MRTQQVRFPFHEERSPPRVTRLDGPDRRLRAGRDVRTLLSAARRTSARGSGRSRSTRARRRPRAAARRVRHAPPRRDRAPAARHLHAAPQGAQRPARGAGAVLILNDGTRGRTGTFPGTLQSPGVRIAVLALSTEAGAALARARAPRVRLRVDAVSEQRTSRNVIAELGDATPRRIVMAGAHLDSVAEGPGSTTTAAARPPSSTAPRSWPAPPTCLRASSCGSASGAPRSSG